MRVSALEVARAIFQMANVTNADEQDTKNLAICVGRGNGAFRIGQTRTVWLVLGPVLSAGDPSAVEPLITATNLRLLSRPRALLSTEAVARTFRDTVSRNIGTIEDGCYPAGYRATWAPALCSDIPPGQVPIGGVLVERRATTTGIMSPDNEYAWYDLGPLADLPVGNVVYRLKGNGVLVAYQRIQSHKWLCVIAAQPTCPVSLESILRRLDATEIEAVPGRPPIVFVRLATPNA
jgi:hypothetical protein